MDELEFYNGQRSGEEIDMLAASGEIGIVVNGNQSALGASVGQFVIVRNSTISGVSNGLYTAAKAIPANTAIDGTYLTAVSGGGLNALLPKLKAKKVNIVPADVFGTNRALSTTSRPVGTASNLLGVSSSKIYSLSVNHIQLTPASMAFVGLYNEALYWCATQNCTLGDSTFVVDVIYYD